MKLFDHVLITSRKIACVIKCHKEFKLTLSFQVEININFLLLVLFKVYYKQTIGTSLQFIFLPTISCNTLSSLEYFFFFLSSPLTPSLPHNFLSYPPSPPTPSFLYSFSSNTRSSLQILFLTTFSFNSLSFLQLLYLPTFSSNSFSSNLPSPLTPSLP